LEGGFGIKLSAPFAEEFDGAFGDGEVGEVEFGEDGMGK
jgi:hypothetical protein